MNTNPASGNSWQVGGNGASRMRVSGAFTLIELMVAIALGALMMMVAIPAMRAARKPPLVRATNDLLEACREARARAVLSGRPMQVVIVVNTRTTELHVEPAPLREFASFEPAAESGLVVTSMGSEVKSKSMFQVELPEDVAFRKILINLRDAMSGDNNAAAIRFFPNGTCDAFDAELQWRRLDARHFTSELVTGLVTAEAMQ